MGALICGNRPGERRRALEALWRPDDSCGGFSAAVKAVEELRRTQSALSSLASGQAGLFSPRALYGPWFNPFGNIEPSSLYDALPLEATLGRLVDFDRLNSGHTRYFATAIDIVTGEDVVFDSATTRIAAEHVRASAALLPVYSPVEIGGRLLGDAGISINLPVDVLLAQPQEIPLLCVAIDLLPLRAPRPTTLGETATRVQDLMFATQSRRAIAAWQAVFAERVRHRDATSITLLHLAYGDQADEVSLKAFDFSPRSAARRWEAGFETVKRAIEQLLDSDIRCDRPGLHVFAPNEMACWSSFNGSSHHAGFDDRRQPCYAVRRRRWLRIAQVVHVCREKLATGRLGRQLTRSRARASQRSSSRPPSAVRRPAPERPLLP